MVTATTDTQWRNSGSVKVLVRQPQMTFTEFLFSTSFCNINFRKSVLRELTLSPWPMLITPHHRGAIKAVTEESEFTRDNHSVVGFHFNINKLISNKMKEPRALPLSNSRVVRMKWKSHFYILRSRIQSCDMQIRRSQVYKHLLCVMESRTQQFQIG